MHNRPRGPGRVLLEVPRASAAQFDVLVAEKIEGQVRGSIGLSRTSVAAFDVLAQNLNAVKGTLDVWAVIY